MTPSDQTNKRKPPRPTHSGTPESKPRRASSQHTGQPAHPASSRNTVGKRTPPVSSRRKAPPRRSGGRYTGKYSRNQSSLPPIVPVALIIALLLVIGLGIWAFVGAKDKASTPTEPGATLPVFTTQEEATQPTEATTIPPEPQAVATATIGSMGDLLMHIQLLTTSRTDGEYDFAPIFRYMTPYITQLDYASANLETTFGGDKFPYQGNPSLNTPDPFARTLKDVGFDMLLTANNHCGDTLAEGIIRTVETVRDAGIVPLGTRASKEGTKYEIADVNGIRLGMICYTYATGVTGDGRPQLNLNAYLSQPGLVNFFTENNLNKFYDELQTQLDAMKSDGAEATIVYLHWGKEYQLEQNATQKAIAQKLCDMGVDAIIGGHPHVVQPMDLLESTVDPEHKTVCIYSMGNAISNQRRNKMRLNTGHTEDGALFTLTFEKYDDGSVRLSETNVLPFWVHLVGTADNPKAYTVIPLDSSRRDSWPELYGLEGGELEELSNSYDRTMAQVGDGLQKCNDYFAQARQARVNPTA